MFISIEDDYYTKEKQLFNVGDELYAVTKDGPSKVVITDVERASLGHYIYRAGKRTYFNRTFGKTLFKTEEECKYAIWRINTIKEKRQLLKEYEEKLNAVLSLSDHHIF